MSDKIKIIFGTFPINSWPIETQQEFLEILTRYGVKDLDTASGYPESERSLGDIGAPNRFTIHTKAPGFAPGKLSKASVLSGATKSLADLQVNSVETYFLHSPDPATPIEETLEAIQDLYKNGKFKRFGLSNFQPEEVQKIYDLASSKGYVLPTVYQGNYNPVARRNEAALFPLLRKLKISFYAYSPLAGGFLVRSPDEIRKASEGRFDKNSLIGGLYHKLYNKPSLVSALDDWEVIAKDAGVSKSALANRWVAYNSELTPKFGDGIIIGASRPSQLEETLRSLEDGPLDEKTVAAIQKVWDAVKDEAPFDNYISKM